MRRMIALLMFLATSGLLAACGSSSAPTATTPMKAAATTEVNAEAATRTLGGTRLPTKAQAKAFVRAVNLRIADVPGFKVSSEHEHETAGEKRLEREMLRCVGTLGFPEHGFAEMGSKDFKHATNMLDQSVQSEVSVARTSSLAAKELAALRNSHVRACLSHYLDLLFKSQKYRGATVSPVSISQGTPPAPGTTGSFAWRITATITLHGVAIPFYIDILGFVYGPAEVSLLTSGVPQSFPAATEERLFSLLLERAKTHDV